MSEVNFNFSGKNFVVVGASSGIGQQIAVELAQNNANVLAIARNESRLSELTEKYSFLRSVILDVTTATVEDWRNIIEKYAVDCGKLDGAVYTAGISKVTPLQSFDEDLIGKIVATSFNGAMKAIHVLSRRKFSKDGASFVFFFQHRRTYWRKRAFRLCCGKGCRYDGGKIFSARFKPSKAKN